jgi:hypothetical protein
MLVGICGQAGSGKDTVADFLCRHHGFVKVAFADPMKRFVQDVFDMSDAQIWGPSEGRNAPDSRYPRCPWELSREEHQHNDNCKDTLTPRYALQTLGTEWGRNCYPNIWVEYAIRIHEQLQGGGYGYDQRRGLFTVSYLDSPRPYDHGEPMMSAKTNVVISDVRFKNEVEGIRKAGGDVFRITRPGADGGVGVAGHASEAEQKSIPDSSFDGTILNNSTIPNLYEIINRVVMALVRQKQEK